MHDGKVTEDFNLRSSINSYASTHDSSQADVASKRREYLPARDVRWSTGHYDHIVATAGSNGRIALYDLNAAGPRIELAWLHEHTGQVNKLDFDPFAGYVLLSASQDKSVRLWDLREPKSSKSRLRFEVRSAVRDVRWSPTVSLDFAVCGDGGVVQKWDARHPLAPKLSINAHEKACYSVDWHPDGRHVVTGGFDRYVRVWDFLDDNRRQKPAFQFRAPHAIRNIRWRPACWSAELAEAGHWQSTQVATSYHHDDPRIHVWDLRRPLLPFRELDRYNNPPNDMLWANKDMLWTVGDEGMFTQTDMTYATQVYNSLPPGASAWMPDGQYYLFSEDRESRRSSGLEDPAVGFLSVPQEKLSSGDDGAASHSLTDDEAGFDSPSGNSFRRRESKAMSSRSAKSQTNTPPSTDGLPPVLSLDKAVFKRDDLFNNKQVGAAVSMPGAGADSAVVEYLAANYAAPATLAERTRSPEKILHRLEEAFQKNADACDAVAMHRMAQSWRVLGAVIIPELKEWADANRSQRKADAAARKQEAFRPKPRASALSPLPGLPDGRPGAWAEAKPQKIMSNLFKGIVEAGRPPQSVREHESSSNMTTPLARPLPDSPDTGRKPTTFRNNDDGIEHMAPLPPSVLSSHSTAAAAARALLQSPGDGPAVTPSSPDRGSQIPASPRERKLTHSSESDRSTDNLLPVMTPVVTTAKAESDPLDPRPTSAEPQKQEARRAALRDYRAQARPIFTFYDPTDVPLGDNDRRHDSAESFPMFSASTDSSQKAKLFGQSVDSLESPMQPADEPTSWKLGREGERAVRAALDGDNDQSVTSSKQQSSRSGELPLSVPSGPSLSGGTMDFSFGLDRSSESRGEHVPKPMQTVWEVNDAAVLTQESDIDPAMSASPEVFHFEAGHSMPKPIIYTSNPMRTPQPDGVERAKDTSGVCRLSPRVGTEDMTSDGYLTRDFCPIDLSRYEPRLPFAWSSLPLICHTIAYDVENGIGQGQFSTHLLMHVHPYFFHQSFRQLRQQARSADALADRLMTPGLGHRVIEGIFLQHARFLQQMGLYESMAALRKICVEFDYPRIYEASAGVEQGGGSLAGGDPNLVSATCSHCHVAIPQGSDVCGRCHRSRAPCPICESLRYQTDDPPTSTPDADAHPGAAGRTMWAFCQACGHSAHFICLTEWFSQHGHDGTCPTQGCGCDCGPGVTRHVRIQEQIKAEEEAALIRGHGPGAGSASGPGAAKKDSLRASASPAVERTRAVLRSSGGGGERAVQSGDERAMSARRGGSRAAMSSRGFSSQRKSVRLVTPGEENERGNSG